MVKAAGQAACSSFGTQGPFLPEVEYFSVKFSLSHGTLHSMGPLGISKHIAVRTTKRTVALPTMELPPPVSDSPSQLLTDGRGYCAAHPRLSDQTLSLLLVLQTYPLIAVFLF